MPPQVLEHHGVPAFVVEPFNVEIEDGFAAVVADHYVVNEDRLITAHRLGDDQRA